MTLAAMGTNRTPKKKGWGWAKVALAAPPLLGREEEGKTERLLGGGTGGGGCHTEDRKVQDWGEARRCWRGAVSGEEVREMEEEERLEGATTGLQENVRERARHRLFCLNVSISWS